MRYIIIFLLFTTVLYAGAPDLEPVIHTLSQDDPQFNILRQEISINLRSFAKNGTLESPLRFFRYTVKDKEDFFSIVTKTMQSPETIASGNSINDPAKLKPGTTLLIPNARGFFATGKREEMVSRFAAEHPVSVPGKDQFWFMPGVKGTFAFKQTDRNTKPSRLNTSGGESISLIYPVSVIHISSGYGTRYVGYGKKRRKAIFHGAIDFAAPAGTEVYAASEGKVIKALRMKGYGNLVVLEHENGYTTYYAHLSKILVKKGDVVSAGDLLGTVGKTGKATGPHLHFELRKDNVAMKPVFQTATISRSESSEGP